MRLTVRERRLVVASVAGAGMLVVAAAVPVWGQGSTTSSAGQEPSGVQAPQPGQSGKAAQPGQSAAAGAVADETLNTYVKTRQQLERDDRSMKSALEAGDFSGRMDRVRSALRGSQMSAEEFVQVHRKVQSDPSLKSRVEAQLGTTAGASGVSGAAAPSGAAPGASPK